MLPVVVLKFGSSVLATATELPLAVDEVYRRLREGSRVLAVVSAFAGDTDRLFARAREVLGDEAAPDAVAAFVATGELQSAALLAGALLRSGVAARIVDPREINLRVEGCALEADPVSVDEVALHALWDEHTTLVLPGFFGIDAQGRVALLGRGGSDLSALFIAGTLKCECHLIKDVAGVFDRDPALDPAGARRYAVIPWHEASEVAGPLIQPKALRLAEQCRTPFTVSRANGEFETRVADVATASWGVSQEAPVRLRIALLGCGTVGRGVYERLIAEPDRFELIVVVTRHPARHVANGVPASIASDDLHQAFRADVDLVIEALSGVEPAGSVIEAALMMGKTVVTANKAAVATYWHEFSAYLAEPDRRLWYGATVGGAVPMLETLGHLRGGVRELRGVINGTCNVVLDAIATGESFDDAVRAAQRSGFAEADPYRDLSGQDSADKLSLMSHAAFSEHVPSGTIRSRGIDEALVAAEPDVWRLLGRARRTPAGVTLSVGPEQMARTSFLGQTAGAENRLEIVLETGEIVRLAGQGAGRWPTTLAVLGDVQAIVRRRARAATP
jgi:homoserine dehydrogenase